MVGGYSYKGRVSHKMITAAYFESHGADPCAVVTAANMKMSAKPIVSPVDQSRCVVVLV